MKKVLSVVNVQGVGVKCNWVNRNQVKKINNRYYHPDCDISFVGKRDQNTDYAVMIALQDCNMPVIALRYLKK